VGGSGGVDGGADADGSGDAGSGGKKGDGGSGGTTDGGGGSGGMSDGGGGEGASSASPVEATFAWSGNRSATRPPPVPAASGADHTCRRRSTAHAAHSRPTAMRRGIAPVFATRCVRNTSLAYMRCAIAPERRRPA